MVARAFSLTGFNTLGNGVNLLQEWFLRKLWKSEIKSEIQTALGDSKGLKVSEICVF